MLRHFFRDLGGKSLPALSVLDYTMKNVAIKPVHKLCIHIVHVYKILLKPFSFKNKSLSTIIIPTFT